MTIDPISSSDPASAQHHWHPFLRYQQECKAKGKEASLNEWMRTTGKLNDLIDFERGKAIAEEEASKQKKNK